MSSSEIHNKFESIFTDHDLTKNYDVYLSFCDQDSGYFVANLYNALKSEAEVAVFWDDERTEYCLVVVPLFYDGIYPTPTDGIFRRSLYADSDFLYRMVIKETTNEEDNFMTCVAANKSAASRAQDVIQLLKQSTRPLLIGIWGMTGIGKSTIA
ncbi:NBS-containing resistance-like protein, partial [Trifolium medium]|nr:NBS-containing resistance-like protein [Trifolium medium]